MPRTCDAGVRCAQSGVGDCCSAVLNMVGSELKTARVVLKGQEASFDINSVMLTMFSRKATRLRKCIPKASSSKVFRLDLLLDW